MSEGMTIVNPATGARMVLRGGQWMPVGGTASPVTAPVIAPAASFVVPSNPMRVAEKQHDADRQAASDRRAEDASLRADASAARSDRSLALQEKRAEAQLGAAGLGKPTEYQAKSAGFLGRMTRANEAWATVPKDSRDPRTVPGQWLASTFPELDNSLNNGDRQASDQNARDFITAVLRQESGASIAPSEYQNAYRTYFPMPGDGPEVLKQKELTRSQAIAGFKVAAGPLAAEVPNVGTGVASANDSQTPGDQSVAPAGERQISKLDALLTNQTLEDDQLAWLTPPLRAELATVSQQARTPDDIVRWFASKGKVLPPEQAQRAIDYYRKGGNLAPVVKPGLTPEQEAEVTRARAAIGNTGAVAMGAGDTMTFGTLDELGSGVEAAFGSGTGDFGDRYDARLAVNRATQDGVRQDSPYLYGAGQLAGAMTPFGAFGRGGTGVGELARVGAMQGGAYGFGSGESGVGSRLISAAGGAGLGAAGGAAFGAVAPRVSAGINSLMNTPARVAGRQAQIDARVSAQPIIDAAQAEGVTISRPFVDPTARNTVTALETTPRGGVPIRQGMAATSSDIEAGVGRLANGGVARDAYGAGTMIQEAGGRFIDKSRGVANRLYARATQLSGNAPVQPSRAIAELDANIAELSQTAETNAPLIGYLESLKRDLSGGLNIDALRNVRSQMRGQINTRNLTATDAERRVGNVLREASGDIETTLASNPQALTAYRRADQFYQQKQTHIKDVIQRFVGRRDAPMSPEQTFERFKSMASAKGDSDRLASMHRTLEPSERLDVAASLAEPLGRNGAGDFSPATLVTQAEKLSQRSLVTVFGVDGAKSLNNLTIIAKEYRNIGSNLNNSRTGVANNYRSWIGRVAGLAGGVGGFMSSGGLAAAGGAVASRAGAQAVEGMFDAKNARLLMSPDFTAWMRSAPATANAAAINRHAGKLRLIATRVPYLAADLHAFERALLESAKGSAGRAVAQGEEVPSDPQPSR